MVHNAEPVDQTYRIKPLPIHCDLPNALFVEAAVGLTLGRLVPWIAWYLCNMMVWGSLTREVCKGEPVGREHVEIGLRSQYSTATSHHHRYFISFPELDTTFASFDMSNYGRMYQLVQSNGTD